MRVRQILRWVVALGGVGFAVLLYLRFERKPVVPAAPAAPPVTDGVTYHSVMTEGGSQIRYKGDQEIAAVSWARLRQFTDGRREIEQLHYEGGRDGHPFVLTADRATLQAPGAGTDPNQLPEETHLIGHVAFAETNGITILADEATFHESAGTLDIPGAVTFSDEKLSGGGVGALYDRGGQLLTLRDQSRIAVKAGADGAGGFTGSSTTMLVNRLTHFVQLDTNASIVRERETLSGDNIQVHLTDGNDGVTLMQLRGHGAVVPTGTGSGATPEMRGDDIDLEFQADGRTLNHTRLMRQASLVLVAATGKQVITGDTLAVWLAGNGQTVRGLNGNGVPVLVQLPAAADTPERRVSGRSLVASGTERDGLTSATFTDSVQYAEGAVGGRSDRGGTQRGRTVNARQLTLALDSGGLGDIKSAHFQTGVSFTSDETSGSADAAVYQVKQGALALRMATPERRAEVRTRQMRVTAREIDLELDRTALTARGTVRTESTPQAPARGAAATGLFDAGKQTFGSADELTYADRTRQAVYRTGAQLVQGAGADLTRIQADVIRADDQAGNLSAEGKVVTLLPMKNAGAGKPDAPARGTASQFVFTSATRTAVYTGTAKELAELPGPDGTVKAVTIEVGLAGEGRELKRLVADAPPGQALVAARIAADRTARGDHLDYDAAAGVYTLDGRPARLIQRQIERGAEKCSETVAERLSTTKSAGANAPDEFRGTGRSGTMSQDLPNCSTWVIK